MKEFLILPYDKINLSKMFENSHYHNGEIIHGYRHYQFFLEYFSEDVGLGAKLIVSENQYTSQAYLDDYQEHYVLAYKQYEKVCKRVHFFSFDYKKAGIEITDLEDFFLKELEHHKSGSISEFWKSYLGYIVIRPLPKGIIGASVLKTYNKDPKRKYTATRYYKINLFGIELEVESLIYIEHDSMLGACATSALFCAFHKLAMMFQTNLPNPNKITLSAGISAISPGRILPNRDGLDALQMCKAIMAINLVPETRATITANGTVKHYDNQWVKAMTYAYCRMGIPVIWGIKFEDLGLHAITITGYRQPEITPIKNKSTSLYDNVCNAISSVTNSNKPQALKNLESQEILNAISLTSYNIERFYCHDDQVGPFARIGFIGDYKIETPWWENGNLTRKRSASFHIMIIPVANIIRITFEVVLTILNRLNFWISQKIQGLSIVWDVYIETSNKYKKLSKENATFLFAENKSVLLTSLPKYVWVAEAYAEGQHLFDIIFDSAEINEEFFAVKICYWQKSIISILREVLTNYSSRKEILEEASVVGFKKEHIELFMKSLNIDLPN